jgi:hypothetical protein
MKNDPKIEKALARIRELKIELAKLERYVRLDRELFPDSVDDLDDAARRPQSDGGAKRWSASDVVRLAMEVLAERNRPMKLGELYLAVVERGAKIGGKNPRNTFCAMLSAEKVTLSTGANGWWFKDEAPPRQLYDSREYEEGPDTDVSRPYSNGATGSYTLAGVPRAD